VSKIYPSTLIALDIEATDISPEKGEIIEVAAVKYRREKIIKTFHTLIKPAGKIPPVIKSITNITDEMVASAPAWAEIKKELEVFIGDFPIVGHNIPFDVDYLRANGVKLKHNIPLDTWRLATIVYQGARSYSLEALTARLGLIHKEKHRATADAAAGMNLFYHLVKKLQRQEREVIDEINNLASRSDWPLAEVFGKIAEIMPPLSSSLKKKSAPASAKITDQKLPVFAAEKLPQILSPNGVARQKIKGYEYRPPQVEMMKYVAAAFAQDQFQLVETPPGVGKSMAYLLPAVTFAKAKKEPVIVSTYTRSLQDQLATKDIPTVAAIVPFAFKTAVLKGRQQYLCRRLLEKFKNQASFSDLEMTFLAKLIVWVNQTKTGEFDELALTREDRPFLRRLAADFHTCQKNYCPHRQNCYVNNSRREAQKADIIIVNHALLLREPRLESEPVLTAKRLIVDEAHELEEAATDAYSHALTKEMTDEWLAKLATRRGSGGLLKAVPRRGSAKFLATIVGLRSEVMLLENDVALFFGLVGMFAKRFEDGGKYLTYEVSLNNDLRQQPEWQRLEDAAGNLVAKIESFCQKTGKLADEISADLSISARTKEWAGDIKGLSVEGRQLSKLFAEMFLEPQPDRVYWVTVRRNEKFILRAAPLRVAEKLQTELYNTKKTVVLTSATLSTARPNENGLISASFDYFKERLGLTDFKFSRVASFFDYKKQALIYIPQDVSLPASPNYSKQLAAVTEAIAKNLGGKTMVLFTSYQGIKSAYNKIADSLKKEKIKVLAQGVTGGKMKLLQQFKEADRAVLLGTATFWQGVDIPGDKLSCLIMAKLPFNVPSEPVFQARQQEYENGFIDYAVPLAILRFRQGFGRLIRSQKDRGVLVIMDRRVEKSNYGLVFLQSLPESSVKYGKIGDLTKTVSEWIGK
jgi:predicted DnaQ family exonuclease/DinG family helicase